MTPHHIAIWALRKARNIGLRELARRTGLDHSYLSRLERGLAGASEDTLRAIALVLEVHPTDLKRGDDVSTETARKREVPAPGTPEGEFFHYTPEEAAEFLPWSKLQLKRKAYARQIPFNEGGSRITFTGRDICEISAMTAVRPLTETHQPVKATA